MKPKVDSKMFCPFCGGKSTEVRPRLKPLENPTTSTQLELLYYVECNKGNCQAHGPVRKTSNAAIKAWMRRKLYKHEGEK